MRAVIQRVSQASVTIAGEPISAIGRGLLVFLGIEEGDEPSDLNWLQGKICRMRIFGDPQGKMNLSLLDTGSEILIVSQFTLHASTKKGNRPSFIRAAGPEISEPLYESFCDAVATTLEKPVARGRFGAQMLIALVNDGPVTISIDSKARE